MRGYIRIMVSWKVCRSVVKGDGMDCCTFKINQIDSKITYMGYKGPPLLSDKILASDKKGK